MTLLNRVIQRFYNAFTSNLNPIVLGCLPWLWIFLGKYAHETMIRAFHLTYKVGIHAYTVNEPKLLCRATTTSVDFFQVNHCFRHTVRSAMTLMSAPIDVYFTNLLTSLRAHTQHVQLLAITPAFLRYLFVKHNFICSGESSIYSCGCRCEPDRLETSQAANKQLAVTLMSLGCTKVVAFGFNDRMLLL